MCFFSLFYLFISSIVCRLIKLNCTWCQFANVWKLVICVTFLKTSRLKTYSVNLIAIRLKSLLCLLNAIVKLAADGALELVALLDILELVALLDILELVDLLAVLDLLVLLDFWDQLGHQDL